jgi:hypothetical protein
MEMLVASVTDLQARHCGRQVVVGSHGAAAVGRYALGFGISSLVVHDAGIGKDEAGVAALGVLDVEGLPAAAIGHMTARIGDPGDMMRRGVVSTVNATAADLGARPGMKGAEVHALFCERTATRTPVAPAGMGEALFRRVQVGRDKGSAADAPAIVALDSASALTAEDDGAVVVTGSHGGLPGGAAGRAAKARPFLAAYNDAGIGIDGAGIGRLAVLDAAGIAAVCVDVWSARIGDALSSWRTGIVSVANRHAMALGARPGMPLRRLVAGLAAGRAAPASERHAIQ